MKMDKQTRVFFIAGFVFLAVVGLGIGAYFAFREPPPQHIVLRDMVREFIFQIENRMEISNEEPHTLRDDLAWYRYNPVVFSKENVQIRKYQKGDPRPPADVQRIYTFDPDAMVYLDLPCDNVTEIFDQTHQTSDETKMVKFECPASNTYYCTYRYRVEPPSEIPHLAFPCRRCNKVYKLDAPMGYAPELTAKGEPPDNPYYTDIADENGRYNSVAFKGAQEIANKLGLTGAKAEGKILAALEYKWIKWPQKQEGEDEAEYAAKEAEYKAEWEAREAQYKIPLGFEGTIRYLETTLVYDPMPRVNRDKGTPQAPNYVRYDDISQGPDEEAKEVALNFGYSVWRRNSSRILEVDVRFLNGRLQILNEDDPRVLVVLEPFHRDEEIVKKGEEMKEAREKAIKDFRAKKGEIKSDKPAEPPK